MGDKDIDGWKTAIEKASPGYKQQKKEEKDRAVEETKSLMRSMRWEGFTQGSYGRGTIGFYEDRSTTGIKTAWKKVMDGSCDRTRFQEFTPASNIDEVLTIHPDSPLVLAPSLAILQKAVGSGLFLKYRLHFEESTHSTYGGTEPARFQIFGTDENGNEHRIVSGDERSSRQWYGE